MNQYTAEYGRIGNYNLYEIAAQGIETTFEMNPGNPFQDAERRLAKGIAWMLARHISEYEHDER